MNQNIRKFLLPAVQQPAQYIGGEFNQIKTEYKPGDVTIALAFHDTYSVGMSHLGFAILYDILNRMPNVHAERAFCPWTDAEAVMRKHDIPLFSWESRTPLHDFDIVGFSLQYELCYTNVLYMLDLAGIPFRSADRTADHPLIIAGGPVADSCEPVADFLDLVILGDGEEALPALVNAYKSLRDEHTPRRDLILELARQFPFVYAPQFYQCDYHPDGTLAACQPAEPGLPQIVERAIVENLDTAPFPTAPLVAHTDIVHNRVAVEIMRGCPQRCAFCHAGHTKGPLRWRSVETCLDLAEKGIANTGHDTASLLSLSTSDYPHLAELVRKLYEQFENQHVGISLPSLRVDRQLRDIPSQVAGVRREGLTVAVEAARDHMRKAIGKRVTDTDLLATMRSAFEAGWRKVKLYFMVGFPYETDDDLLGIVDLAAQISQLRRDVAKGPASVNAAIAWLVPKPHTPFAWIDQKDLNYFQHAKDLLINTKYQHKGLPIKLKFHHMERSILEAVFARGDRRLSHVLETAYKNGARFDGWDECFSYRRYLDAFATHNLDPAFYAHRPRTDSEILSWDHLAHHNKLSLITRLSKIKQSLTIGEQ